MGAYQNERVVARAQHQTSPGVTVLVGGSGPGFFSSSTAIRLAIHLFSAARSTPAFPPSTSRLKKPKNPFSVLHWGVRYRNSVARRLGFRVPTGTRSLESFGKACPFQYQVRLLSEPSELLYHVHRCVSLCITALRPTTQKTDTRVIPSSH
jgi:hypothetical protein